MHYLIQKGNALDAEEFISILEQNTPRYREEIMTIAEHLEQKGLQKGLKKGLQKGLQKGIQEGSSKREREIARNFLSLGTDRALVEQATGLSRDELDALMTPTLIGGGCHDYSR